MLPYARAFVVQFTSDTDSSLRHPVGRVEHLQTGRRFHFASVDELVARIASLLAGQTPSPAKPTPRRSTRTTPRRSSRGR